MIFSNFVTYKIFADDKEIYYLNQSKLLQLERERVGKNRLFDGDTTSSIKKIEAVVKNMQSMGKRIVITERQAFNATDITDEIYKNIR